MEVTTKEIQELRSKIFEKLEEDYGPNKLNYFHPSDMARITNSDDWLRRFLLHHDNDMKEALQMVFESCQWRKDNQVNDISEHNLNMEYLEEGSMFVHNRDNDGKLLFIFKCKKHVKGQKDLDELKRCVVYWFERVERLEKSGAMITIFFDMQDTGLSNLDMEYTKYLIGLCKLYYPNFLNYILIFEMPWVLNAAFKVIKAWLPAKGVQKIKFVNKNNLKDYVSADQALSCWGGNDEHEFKFIPESMESFNGKIDDSKKKVHFADGSPLIEGVPSGFGDIRIEEYPQNSTHLRVLPSEYVLFSEGHSSEMSGTVRLTNVGSCSLTYKIKTTSPEKFRVRPSLGILHVNGSCSINVLVQPGFTPHSIIRDKFLIMSFATDLQNPSNVELSELWKNADSKKICQHRLKCSVAPHSSSQNGAAFNVALQSHSYDSDTDQKISHLINAVNHMTQYNEKLMSEISYVSTLEKIIIVLVILLGFAVYIIYSKLPLDNHPSSSPYCTTEHCGNDNSYD